MAKRSVIVYSTTRNPYFDDVEGVAYADPARYVSPQTTYPYFWTDDATIKSECETAGMVAYPVDANMRTLYAQIRVFTATASTVMTGEATTQVGATKSYQITNAVKRLIDETVDVVVYDGITNVTANVESVDYMFGIVTFAAAYIVVGAVTVHGAYLTAAVDVCTAA